MRMDKLTAKFQSALQDAQSREKSRRRIRHELARAARLVHNPESP